VQGESFAGVGGGYVTTRVTADAVWYATMGTSAIRRLQKQVLQDAQQIASTLTKAGVSVADPIALRAHFADGHVFVVEESSGTVVKFGDFPVLAG